MSDAAAFKLYENGTHLQNNRDVKRIYTAVEPNGDGSWDVATVVETDLELDASRPGHDPRACDRLVQDIEADLRAGNLWGRVTLRRA